MSEVTESEKSLDEIAQKPIYSFFKRMQDIILSLLALIALSPLMLVTAIAIVIDDPHGGPIFVQHRCGKNGKTFKMMKFRSMYIGAEDRLEELLEHNEADGPAFKMTNDPRITKVGKIIRKTSIDEIPQFFNVLAGSMSLVGPRPPIPREVAQYNEYQMKRLAIKPGLTCFWQIQHSRNDLSFDEWMELDLKYIKSRSFAVDWKILFGTVGAVIGLNGK